LKTVEGVEIFGTASKSKHEYLRALGCDHPIDYHSEDYADVIRQRVGDAGLDIVLDALGGKDWKRGWDLLAPTGRLVAFGFANVIQGSQRKLLHVARALAGVLLITPMQAMDQNKSLQGVNMGHLWSERRRLAPQLERIVQLWEEGVVRPHVHAAVPFAEAARAHAMLESRQSVGKVVLVP
jgi:NADPH:quinone reductase-like Zn-dependent oxidoreductase